MFTGYIKDGDDIFVIGSPKRRIKRMQRKISFKWLAILMIVPMILTLVPSGQVKADSTGIRYVDGVLSWDAVDNAAYYYVNVLVEPYNTLNHQKKTTSLSYDLRDAMNKDNECPSGTYEVHVQAYRNNGINIKAYKLVFYYTAVMPRLETPVPRFNGKTVKWDPVENADSYRVQVQVGQSPSVWYSLDHAIAKTITGTSMKIDDDFIESDLYYIARIEAYSKGKYIKSAIGETEIVTGSQLLNGYQSPVKFSGKVTMNNLNPTAGDTLHATLTGVSSDIPSSAVRYNWHVAERIGAAAYSGFESVQYSDSPDFVVPENAGHIALIVDAEGYEGYIRVDIFLTLSGWYKTSAGNKYYYIDNQPVTGWQQIRYVHSGTSRKEWFYFDSTGIMQTGRVTIDGKTYVFGSTGVFAEGWLAVGKNRYYCTREDGLVTGWKEIKGEWYYFDFQGAMQTGWNKVSGTWYYLDSDGKMQKNWQFIDGVWYYFGGSGAMRTGWQQIGGKWYYLGGNGAMRKGWQQLGGKWYYFKSSGAMAAEEFCDGYWLNADGTWTYKHRASWRYNSKGWWFGDDTGWYAKNQTYYINEMSYDFDKDGYWIQN